MFTYPCFNKTLDKSQNLLWDVVFLAGRIDKIILLEGKCTLLTFKREIKTTMKSKKQQIGIRLAINISQLFNNSSRENKDRFCDRGFDQLVANYHNILPTLALNFSRN